MLHHKDPSCQDSGQLIRAYNFVDNFCLEESIVDHPIAVVSIVKRGLCVLVAGALHRYAQTINEINDVADFRTRIMNNFRQICE